MAHRLRRIWAHWSTRVVLIFLASRVVTTAMLLWFAAHQQKNSWTAAHPDYFAFSQLWDSHWYYLVAMNGYPERLPVITDATGVHIYQNAWAFMPLYPWLVRLLGSVTAVPYEVMAVLVSLLCALAAALVSHQLFAEAGLARWQSLGAVALLCVNPVSAVLQVGYAEPLMLLILSVALLLLQRRRYLWLIPLAFALAFTRPAALPLALAIALHVVLRWWRAWKGREPFPWREQVAAISAAAASLVAGFTWMLIAAAATGRMDAYTATELSWRAPYIGYRDLVPFTSWYYGADWWSRWLGIPSWAGIAVLVLCLVAVAGLLCTPAARRLGPTIRIWVVSWLVYLLAVFFPQSSTWRLLLPAYPALGALALRRWTLWAAIAVCLIGQWVWIAQEWYVSTGDWTPP